MRGRIKGKIDGRERETEVKFGEEIREKRESEIKEEGVKGREIEMCR